MISSSPDEGTSVRPTQSALSSPAPSVEVSESESPTASSSPTPMETKTESAFNFADMEDSFAQLQNSLNGPAGIAIASGEQVWSTGTKQTDFAWSTSKVPVSIAALKANKSKRNLARVRSAITVSSNSAAHALWESLGGYRKSAQAVSEVLASGGDHNTVVNYGGNNFGLTKWAISDSAIFADHLPCMTEATSVYSLMGSINKSHRWGLGTISGTHFKGGWGPVDSGYIVRQIGVVPTSENKFFGVAIMVDSKHGQIRGQNDLTRIASWLKKYLSQIPAHTC